jgi:hypothetical protein
MNIKFTKISKKFIVQAVCITVVAIIGVSACTAQSAPQSASLPARQQPQPGGIGGSGYVSSDLVANTTTISQPANQPSESQEQYSDANITDTRIVLKNASLNLVVDDTAATLRTIATDAEEMGGWVVASNSYQNSTATGSMLTYGSITVRVPAAKLNDILARFKALAVTVNTENITGEDVTQRDTDLKSQLTNLEAAETQLRKIIDGATKTEDVLAVYRELTNVRGQIEVIKGQIKYYDEAATFSSVAVNLTPSEASKPLVIGGWEPGSTIKNAIQTLVRTLQGLVDLAIWLAIVVLPFALVLLVIIWLYRRRKPRRIVQNTTPVSPDSAGNP